MNHNQLDDTKPRSVDQQQACSASDYHWLTTALNPRTPLSEPRGWRLHAVKASKEGKFSAIRFTAALCGLTPRHGWGSDLFIEDACERCHAAMERLEKQNAFDVATKPAPDGSEKHE